MRRNQSNVSQYDGSVPTRDFCEIGTIHRLTYGWPASYKCEWPRCLEPNLDALNVICYFPSLAKQGAFFGGLLNMHRTLNGWELEALAVLV